MFQLLLYRLILLISIALWEGSEWTIVQAKTLKNDPEVIARQAFREGDYAKVISLLQNRSHEIEISRSSSLLLAESFHAQKKYEDEVRVLNLVLKSTPDDHGILLKVGDAYGELKKTEEAVSAYRAAMSKNKKFLPSYEKLLILFESNNIFYEARDLLKDMIKIFGNKKEFLHKLCRLDSLDGYLNSSTKTCLEAIQRDPSYPDSYVYLANNYRDLGEKSKAQKIYGEAAKKFPTSEFVQSAAGRYFSENQDFHSAAKHFSLAVQVDSHSVRAQIGLAKSSFEIGDFKTSLDAFKKACQQDRGTTLDFRRAAAQLRAKQNYKWSVDFETQSHLCRLKD